MSLQTRVARLDDASGELTLSLRKLEMEAARGMPNRDEQIDFLHDLHRAAYRVEIHPWRTRAWRGAVVGLLVAGGTLLLPPGIPRKAIIEGALLALGGLSLATAVACLGVFFRNLARERRWFRQREAEVLAGRSLLEAP
jgi:hypothetical protein